MPPGRCLVLRIDAPAPALWVTSWPFAEYTRHDWAGAWINSAFRNEGAGLSSELIRAGISATLWKWPNPPDLGMITFVNRDKIANKRNPGFCYLKAGFRRVGETKGGLLALQLLPADMPKPSAPINAQLSLIA